MIALRCAPSTGMWAPLMKLASGGQLEELDTTAFLAQGTEYESAQNYRGMHGSFSPIDVHNTMIARGPDFKAHFSVKWMHKDIGLMLESAQELNVPLFLTALTRQLFQTAITRGHGEEDICSTIKVLEELTGTEVKG